MNKQAWRSALRWRSRLLFLRMLGLILRRARQASPPQSQRILVIKPDHLGDVLLLTPALRLLRQQLPMAHITLLIGPWSQAAVAHNPDVDAVLICPFPGFTRTTKASLLQPYWVVARTALLLRAGHFDTAIIARDDHWWGALLAALAGIPCRIGHAVPETVPLLTTALPHRFTDHVTQQNIALVEALTGRPADERPLLRAPIGKEDCAWATTWLAEHGIASNQKLVALHPGTGGRAKLWQPQCWAEVATALHERGLEVVLTGDSGDRALVEAIVCHMARPPLTLIGATTIGQLAALYRRCVLVLGVDSGPLHLAVAAGTPTISLFGPSDHRRFRPWGDPQRQVVLRSGLWCSPCGVLDACPRGTAPSECMTRITVPQVLAAIHRLINSSQLVARLV
jgi:lipopolysaccharide heptosyltransferase II